jgi:hypothetical protein
MMTMAEARLRSGIMGTWELMFASQWLDDFQGQKFEDGQKSLRYLKVSSNTRSLLKLFQNSDDPFNLPHMEWVRSLT